MGNPWAVRSAKKTGLRVYLERLSHNQDSTLAQRQGTLLNNTVSQKVLHGEKWNPRANWPSPVWD